MNETAQLILAYATLVTSMTAAIVSIINTLRLNRVSVKVEKVSDNVQVIEKATNSMKDALVAASKEASLAEGTLVGLAQGRAEQQNSEDQPQKVEIVKLPDNVVEKLIKP